MEDRDGAQQSADQMVPLLMGLLHPSSVVDVGCALGTWLKVFERHGVVDYVAVDGDWVNRRLLEIEASRFVAADLRKPLDLQRRFELVLCLEVAEHLPATSAGILVESLTRLGDLVLFSAAVPSQGGVCHVNEQWPAYWAKYFRTHGYVAADVLRPRIWTNSRIAVWYRQNALLFIRESALSSHPLLEAAVKYGPPEPLGLLHPERNESDASSGMLQAVRSLWRRARDLGRTIVN